MIVAVIANRMGLRLRQVLIAGEVLSSSGEFSLVLLNRAADLGGLTPEIGQILLSSTAISMALVSTLMSGSLPFPKMLEKWPFFQSHGKNGELRNGAH